MLDPYVGTRQTARQLAVHLPRHGRCVAALAVLETLRTTGGQREGSPGSGAADGTSLAGRILARTREVAARDLHVPAETLNDSELLTQAGWTLLRAVRRHLASDLARAAWDVTTTAATGKRRSTPPDELLELAIELAGVQYSHSEHAAASATLHPDLCAVLDGPYPPGEDWGEVVSAVFYHQLRTTLVNPHESAEQLRTEWVQTLGPGWSTAYPSKWSWPARPPRPWRPSATPPRPRPSHRSSTPGSSRRSPPRSSRART